MSTYFESDAIAAEFAERVRNNQAKLISDLKPRYDFVVCGSGSSGSVVARRLAENPDASVLLKGCVDVLQMQGLVSSWHWEQSTKSTSTEFSMASLKGA